MYYALVSVIRMATKGMASTPVPHSPVHHRKLPLKPVSPKNSTEKSSDGSKSTSQGSPMMYL